MAYRHLLPYSPTLFHYKNRPSIFCTEKSTGGYLQHLVFLPDNKLCQNTIPRAKSDSLLLRRDQFSYDLHTPLFHSKSRYHNPALLLHTGNPGFKRSFTAPLIEQNTHAGSRSEEHTSELQSRGHLVCRLLLEK